MREIVWLWSSTVAWLALIPFLLPEDLSPGRGVFVLGSAVAILIVTVPGLRRLDLRWFLLLALIFVALGMLSAGGGGSSGWKGLLGLVYAGGAVALSTRLGRKLVRLEDALGELAAGSPHERAEPFEDGQHDIYRELRRARRYERPGTLMALSASGAEAASERLLAQLQREFAESYADAQVAKLLCQETDAAAVITRRERRFLVYLPETGAEAAEGLARRLAAAAAERWGLELRSGIACFPDEELTFEGLLERAEQALAERERKSWKPALRERRARGALRLADGAEAEDRETASRTER